MSTNIDPLIAKFQESANSNVFVIMRYRPVQHFADIEKCIRKTLLEFGLIARFAKDGALVSGLWNTLELYMKYSRFGIAIFEDIDERDFNPNIPLELGYMLALGRRCLILKEKRMPRLPTDILGFTYRDFDVLDLSSSLRQQIRDWCSGDLGLPRKVRESEIKETEPLALVYDNKSEDPNFRTWGLFNSALAFENSGLVADEGEEGDSPRSVFEFKAVGTESMGANKIVQLICGRAKFQYKAMSSGAPNPNLLFCMIPMHGTPAELLEVGAQRRSEAANAYSPYRMRYFVPEAQIGDGGWHEAEIDFDFRFIPTATYTVFAPRINEGCPRPGPGQLRLRNFQLLAAQVSSSESPKRGGLEPPNPGLKATPDGTA